ncbi:MAG: FHA domain-containing protein, partial [Phycisphaeraceae bacterium]
MLKLRLLTGPRAGRQLRVSDTKPVSIGRRKGRLRLHDSRVSKNHAEIYYDNGLWLLRDLGSANGTFVNRKRVKGMIELEPGDQIQMGRVLLKIVRCDMIGMDTQAFTPDEPSEAKVSALAPPDIKTDPTADEDDFDLEDLFGDSEENEDDLNEASAAFDAIAAIDAPAEVSDVQIDVEEIELADQAVPEPVEIEFDEPVDDDDSFFADIGESTDATNGDAVSLVDDDDDFSSADDAVDHAQDESHAPIELAGEETPKAVADDRPIESHEEPDPFLSAEPEPEEESTGDDLISLDDESGGGPRSAGTTLLTAAHDDGTPIDTAEHSDGVSLDEAEDEDDDADDEPPALVGLALEHAPPQQPVATDEEALAQDIAADDVEDEITSDESAELDELDEPDESIEFTEVEEPLAPAVEVIAELDAEPIAEEIVEDLNLEPEAAADVELEEPTFEIDEIEIDETAF